MGGGGALRWGVEVVVIFGFGRVFFESFFGVRFWFNLASDSDATDLAGFITFLLPVEVVFTSDLVWSRTSSLMIPMVKPSVEMF